MGPSSTPARRLALLFIAALLWPVVAAGNVWQLDRTFQPALEDPSSANGAIAGVFPLPDGGVLVNTTYTIVNGQPVNKLVRLHADGTFDTTFHPPADAMAASVTPEGKILATKSSTFSNVPWIFLRLLSNGAEDPAFQVQPIGAWGDCNARVQANGQILVYGILYSVGGVPAGCIARLNSDGSLDRTLVAPFDRDYSQISDVSVQSDGRIVVVGELVVNGVTRQIVRLNLDGSIDPQFTPEALNPGVTFKDGVQVLANGQILVVSLAQIAVRLNPDGTLDSSYKAPDGSSYPNVGRPLANGHIYYVDPSGSDGALRRLNFDGSVDGNFNVSSPAYSLSVPATWDESSFYFSQAFTADRSASRQFVTKLDASGALVSSFAPRFSGDASVTPAGRSANGAYLLSGQIDYASGVKLTGTTPTTIRLQTDGSLDTSLHPPSGMVPLAVEPDGHFVAIDSDSVLTISTVARYATDGSLAATYDLTALGYPFVGTQRPIADDGAGLLYATGSQGLHRLAATGAGDPSFNAAQFSSPTQIIPTVNGNVFVVYDVPPQSDSLPYGGSSSSNEAPGLHAVRLLSTGAGDPSFAEISLPSADGSLFCGLPDGGLLLIQDLNSNVYLHFVRYDATGQAKFTYDGPRNDALMIAGVLYDSLVAGKVAGEVSITPYPTLPNLWNLPIWIDVRSDGQVTFDGLVFYFHRGSLVRYNRMPSAGPSVSLAPSLALDPIAVAPQNGNASFTVATYGEEPFTYQWRFNGQPLNRPGTAGDQATLQIANVQAADLGAYSVTVSNRWGTVTSAIATLSMDAPSPIVMQPMDQAVREGASASISVASNAISWARLQWQIKRPEDAGWTDLADDSTYVGTQDYTLTVTSVGAGMSGNQYRCIVTGDTGNATSVAATLTVTSANDLSGTYSCYTALNGSTRWAMKINPDGTGTFIAYIDERQSAFVGHLTVGATGAFSGKGAEISSTTNGTAGETAFSGIIAPDGSVAGQIPGLNVAFLGQADTAVRANTRAGLYVASALGTNAGTVYTIVSAGGQAIVVIADPAEVDSTTASLDPTGQLTITTWNDTQVALTLDSSGQNMTVTLDGILSATPSSYVAVEASAASKRLVNISARALAGTGDNVAIGGFVVSGSAAKKYLIRAVGPTLATQGIASSEVMLDPTIELHDALHGNAVIATNDNWGDNMNRASILSVSGQIGANALASTDTTSSALLPTLAPGVYSFIAQGKSGATGVVLLEVYDADPSNPSATLVNLSARARATTGSGVTIGGFVVNGNAPKHLLVRAVGPTLTTQGLNVLNVLQDPIIEVHDAAHGNAVIAANDNWGDDANSAEITAAAARVGATPFAAVDTTSSALLLTVEPGIYSFVASGKNGSAGIVLVEVYDAD